MGRARPATRIVSLKTVAQVDARVGPQRDGGAADVLGADGRSAARHAVELLDEAARDGDGVGRAHEGELVAARVDLRARLALDELEVAVALAVQSERDAVVVEGHALGDDARAQARSVSTQSADSTRPARRFNV